MDNNQIHNYQGKKNIVVLDQIIFPYSLIIKSIEKYATFLNKFYHHQKLSVIAVLNGAAFFAVHLISNLVVDVEVDFVAASSYQGGTKTKTKFYKETKIDITNRHLLLIEDIIDTGKTARIVYDFFLTLKPRSIRLCALVKGFKINQQLVTMPVDFLLTLPKYV